MQTPTFLNTLEVTGMTLTAILAQLEEVFPPTNPTPDMTMEQIMYRSGQRSVVEWILHRIDEENYG